MAACTLHHQLPLPSCRLALGKSTSCNANARNSDDAVQRMWRQWWCKGSCGLHAMPQSPRGGAFLLALALRNKDGFEVECRKPEPFVRGKYGHA